MSSETPNERASWSSAETLVDPVEGGRNNVATSQINDIEMERYGHGRPNRNFQGARPFANAPRSLHYRYTVLWKITFIRAVAGLVPLGLAATIIADGLDTQLAHATIGLSIAAVSDFSS